MSYLSSGRQWPLSIIGIFIFLAFMLFGILYISLVYVPVNKENVYLMDYQQVDKEYNDIFEAQKAFDEHYAIRINTKALSTEPVETIRANGEKVAFEHAFSIGTPSFLEVVLQGKQGETVDNAKITVLLTRYETAKFDKVVAVSSEKAGTYLAEPFVIEQAGRWKVIVRAEVNGFTGYAERGVFAQ